MNELRKKTISGFIYKMLERVGAQGVNFIVSLVLARLLLPDEYGLISLVLVIINILDVFVTYGFGNSLIADKNSDSVDFSTCFYFGLVFSCLVYAALFFAAPYISIFYKSPKLEIVLKIMGLRVPIAAINSVQQAYVSKHMMFKKFFISTSIGTVVSGVIAIIMAYYGAGVWALVEQYMGNVICDTICLWLIVGWRPIKAFSIKRLKKIYDYGWKILLVGLIDTGYSQMRSLVIAKRYSNSDLAYYNKGNQFPALGMNIIEPTINGVLFPALSQCQDDVSEMRSITRRMIKVSTYLVFPIMIGLIVVAEPLVTVLLTEKWIECVPYLQICCVAYLFRPLQFINNSVIKASGNGGLLLKLDVIKKIFGIILLLISMPFGVKTIAISFALTNYISTIINIGPNRKILDYGYRQQIKDVFLSGLASVIMGGVVFYIGKLNIDTLLLLVLQVFSGVILYFCLSKILHIDSFDYLLQMLKNIREKRQA